MICRAALLLLLAAGLTGCLSSYVCDRQSFEYGQRGEVAPCIREMAFRGLTEEQKRLRALDQENCWSGESRCPISYQHKVRVESSSWPESETFIINWRVKP
ncbi:MAG TPA: hypothetical protein ENJ30_12555 [Desulfobulbaceae bacterium]|nr:hypothetical protein [Desulfobulbaceae bacterium]